MLKMDCAWVLLIAMLVALSIAPPGHASTVAVYHYKADRSYYFRYENYASASNDVRLTAFPNTIRVADANASLEVREGCTSLGPHDARCRRPLDAGFLYHVLLGSGNDAVELHGDFDGFGRAADHLLVDGGAGNDTLRGSGSARSMATLGGGAGDDIVSGGPSHEDLGGGSGTDRISGGAGDDYIMDGYDPGAHDAIDGGDGIDTVSYDSNSGMPRPLTVDLARGVGGYPGQLDGLRDVENITAFTYDGPATLIGDARPNHIFVDGKPSTVRAGAGNDHLEALTGAHRLDAGQGNDTVDVNKLIDWPRDDIRCGPGVDRVAPNPRALVRAGCELLLGGDLYPGSKNPVVRRQPVFVTGDRRLAFRLPCHPGKKRKRCYVVAGIAKGVADEPLTQSDAVWVERGRVARIDLPLTEEQRQAVANGGLTTGVYVASRAKKDRFSKTDYAIRYRTVIRESAAAPMP